MLNKNDDTQTLPAIWNGKNWCHFNIHPKTCCLYGDKPEDIVQVTFRIANDQHTTPTSIGDVPDYWGWLDTDTQEFDSLIYPRWFLLDMCFPYGITKTEEAGKGRAYRLEMLTKPIDNER